MNKANSVVAVLYTLLLLGLAAYTAHHGYWPVVWLLLAGAALTILIGLYWPKFCKKYPLPERQPGEPPLTMFGRLSFWSKIPGWPGWMSKGLIAILIIAPLLRLYDRIMQIFGHH